MSRGTPSHGSADRFPLTRPGDGVVAAIADRCLLYILIGRVHFPESIGRSPLRVSRSTEVHPCQNLDPAIEVSREHGVVSVVRSYIDSQVYIYTA